MSLMLFRATSDVHLSIGKVNLSLSARKVMDLSSTETTVAGNAIDLARSAFVGGFWAGGGADAVWREAGFESPGLKKLHKAHPPTRSRRAAAAKMYRERFIFRG